MTTMTAMTLTPGSYVLQKSSVAQVLKNFPTFNGARRFRGSLPCSQKPTTGPYPEPINPVHIAPFYFYKIHLILIFSHLCLPSGPFPSGFSTKMLYAFLFSLMLATMPCLSHPPSLNHSNYIWRTVQVMKLPIMQYSPTSYRFIPVRSKYSPQHPVHKPPKSMFLP
jgi:hypothetical protein